MDDTTVIVIFTQAVDTLEYVAIGLFVPLEASKST